MGRRKKVPEPEPRVEPLAGFQPLNRYQLRETPTGEQVREYMCLIPPQPGISEVPYTVGFLWANRSYDVDILNPTRPHETGLPECDLSAPIVEDWDLLGWIKSREEERMVPPSVCVIQTPDQRWFELTANNNRRKFNASTIASYREITEEEAETRQQDVCNGVRRGKILLRKLMPEGLRERSDLPRKQTEYTQPEIWFQTPEPGVIQQFVYKGPWYGYLPFEKKRVSSEQYDSTPPVSFHIINQRGRGWSSNMNDEPYRL